MERQGSARGAIWGVLAASATTAAIGYFSFAAIQGNYGLVRLIQVEAREAQLVAERDGLRAERRAIENKTERLSLDYLDMELLDEQARKVLGLARGDEIVLR